MKVTMEIKPEDIIESVKMMNTEERDAFLEDLLAATSPEYLKSIRQARSEYQTGKVKTHQEVFGE